MQSLLNRNAKTLDFETSTNLFAGYLKCADCGRSMVKTRWQDRVFYSCGSYKRYGPTACTRHYIPQKILEQTILEDLNSLIKTVPNLSKITENEMSDKKNTLQQNGETERLKTALERVKRLRQSIYEDYKDELLTRDEYLRYRKDYEQQEAILSQQLEQISLRAKEMKEQNSWMHNLIKDKCLTELDRATIAATIKEIQISEDGGVEI